jgi:hypothetical protein
VPSAILRLWPLLLVAWGIGLVLRATPLAAFGGVLSAAAFGLLLGSLLAGGASSISGACIGSATGGEVSTRSGTAVGGSFRASVELTCGDLTVERAPGSAWSVEARHAPGHPPPIEGSATALSIRSPEWGQGFDPFGGEPRREWRVHLPTEPAISLDMTLNAGSARVDLGGGSVDSVGGTINAGDVEFDLGDSTFPSRASLGLTLNAASGTLVLPDDSLTGAITLNASSLEVCVPPDAAVRVRHQGTLSSDELDEAGLVRDGDWWQTPGFEAAADSIELSVTSTVSSMSLDRSGGCR